MVSTQSNSLAPKFLPAFRHLTCFILFLAALACVENSAHAATVSVPAGGDLQAALNAAQPGDTILLAAGATYTGSFTLPNKTGTNTDADWITIRTDAPDSALPADGQRITPDYAPVLPKLLSAGRAAAVVQTEPGAHHYRFIGIEFARTSPDAIVYDL